VLRRLVCKPTEPWGVPNDARPTLRAPTCGEAVFTLTADMAERVLDIQGVR
jgi:uncharacterized protein (DUF2141 family)